MSRRNKPTVCRQQAPLVRKFPKAILTLPAIWGKPRPRYCDWLAFALEPGRKDNLTPAVTLLEIGREIHRLRKKHGLTRHGAAKLCFTNASYISVAERGILPDYSIARRIMCKLKYKE